MIRMLYRHGLCAPQLRNGRQRAVARTAPAQTIPVHHCEHGLFNLSSWIVSKGGAVNGNLELEDEAPCGERGIIARTPGISLADLEQGPLITLPYSLYFETSKAAALITQALASHPSTSSSTCKANPSVAAVSALHQVAVEQRLSSVQILGLALALERQQGTDSAWHSYIASLPQAPPCPWLLPEHTGAVACAVANALSGDTSQEQPMCGLDDVARAAASAAAAAAVAATAGGLVASSDPAHLPSQTRTAAAAAAAAAAATAAAGTRSSRANKQLQLRADVAVADGACVPGTPPGSSSSTATPAAAAAAAAVVARDGVRAAAAAALALAEHSGAASETAWVVPNDAGRKRAPPTGAQQQQQQQQQQQRQQQKQQQWEQRQQVQGPPPCLATSLQQPPPLYSNQSVPQAMSQPLPLPHPDQSAWEAAVRAARAEHEATCQEALDVCGSQLGLDMADMRWGLGQVLSRALTSGDACGLLPLIDLLNHHPDARPPMLQLDDNDQVVMTVTSLKGNEVVPLQPGEELYINYSGGGALTPLESFLKFGFVPSEAWGTSEAGTPKHTLP